MRRKITAWLLRLLARWEVLPHPYGENYAKREIGPLGGCRAPDGPERESDSRADSPADS